VPHTLFIAHPSKKAISAADVHYTFIGDKAIMVMAPLLPPIISRDFVPATASSLYDRRSAGSQIPEGPESVGHSTQPLL
jgi:hypothetical protein